MAHGEGPGTGRVVVGLGNPGPEYRDTRHNVGQRVLDVLAKTVRGSWRRDGTTIVARGRWRGEEVRLIKPLSFMNCSGPPLARLLSQSGGSPADRLRRTWADFRAKPAK